MRPSLPGVDSESDSEAEGEDQCDDTDLTQKALPSTPFSSQVTPLEKPEGRVKYHNLSPIRKGERLKGA